MNQKLENIYNETIGNILRAAANEKPEHYVPTGFPALDSLIFGLPYGELIILGGRPAMGKIALMDSLLLNILSTNTPAAYISLEGTANHMLLRMCSNLSGIPLQALMQGNSLTPADLAHLKTSTSVLTSLPLQMHEDLYSIEDIQLYVEQQSTQNGVKLFFIDYLQIIKVEGHRMNREAEIAKISRELKTIARKFNVCLFVSSQLSRAVESRGGDKRPQLSDLRESGAIEQDADKVLFLHRPEYYGITIDENGHSLKGQAEIIVAKNRMGVTGSCFLSFNGVCCRFSSYVPFEETDDFKNVLDNLLNNKFDNPF